MTFMVLAPEHELVGKLTAPEYKDAVENYLEEAKNVPKGNVWPTPSA